MCYILLCYYEKLKMNIKIYTVYINNNGYSKVRVLCANPVIIRPIDTRRRNLIGAYCTGPPARASLEKRFPGNIILVHYYNESNLF